MTSQYLSSVIVRAAIALTRHLPEGHSRYGPTHSEKEELAEIVGVSHVKFQIDLAGL